MKMNKEQIMREIYWRFRRNIHAGHGQIKITNGKAELFKDKDWEDTSCYGCDLLHQMEEDIADIFGEDYITCDKIGVDSHLNEKGEKC